MINIKFLGVYYDVDFIRLNKFNYDKNLVKIKV